MSLKSRARVFLNRFFEPAGFCIARFAPEYADRAPVSPELAERQTSLFVRELREALRPFPELASAKYPTIAEVDEFRQVLTMCPIRQSEGGSGFNGALLLWTLARMTNPSLIVESGVFRGFSSWILAQACPDATRLAFDVSLAQLRHRAAGAQYFEHDWMDIEVRADPVAPTFAFFDDHVDQWRRIREAAVRGFRYCLFDDSLPVTALQSDGVAAVPTVDMLFDDTLVHNKTISWHTECGAFTYTHDADAAQQTRAVVSAAARLPSLRLALGYRPSNLALVALAVP